jgi:hypothetical protein
MAPIRASETDDLAFHLATVFGLIPYRRQQIVAILVQAINGARIFGTVFLAEGLECKLRDSPDRRYRDVLQAFFMPLCTVAIVRAGPRSR